MGALPQTSRGAALDPAAGAYAGWWEGVMGCQNTPSAVQFVLNCDRSTVKHALQIATSGFITALECTPDPLADLKGSTSKGRGEKGTGKEGREKNREGQGTGEWKGRGRDPRERGRKRKGREEGEVEEGRKV